MFHLGFNVYLWSSARPLGLLRTVRDMVTGELAGPGGCRLFYDYFDARGPHYFFLFSSSRPLDRQAIESRLARALEEEPLPADLARELVEARHRACLGKAMCSADEGDELVAHGSLVFFEQTTDRYPFFLTTGHPEAESFWQLFSELSLLGIELLQGSAGKLTGTALEWMAAVDDWADRHGLAEEYWRYHLASLMLGLADRINANSLGEELVDGLEATIGRRNRENFDKAFAMAGRRTFAPLLPELCRLATLGGGRRSLGLLREVQHAFLKQLGVMPASQLPIVLYCWLRQHRKIEVGP